MTLEELWDLFPIVLKEHNPRYAGWYEQQRAGLIGLLGDADVARISHIGSTAVPGLLAKPTVDILLEVRASSDVRSILDRLQAAGWLLMSEQSDPLDLALNKGYTPEGFAEQVYHLHVRYLGDWDEPYFRDYLRDHAEAAAEYAELKQVLLERYEHDRDAYTEAKTDLIHKYTQLARIEYADRYNPSPK